jgi:catechol 2,3-dioxygenase-like lactoylglutathione lyase family enzyme
MAFHHVAVATRDLAATHRFYTEVMGFTLAKVVAAPSPEPGAWARHVFYDTGDGLIAFWDLHGDYPDFEPALSGAMGLPVWVNHLAFRATDPAHLDACRQRWLDHGHDVMEVDHEFCVSIYTMDPNGTMVEWCMDTRAFTPADRAEAEMLMASEPPPLSTPPQPVFHRSALAAEASG